MEDQQQIQRCTNAREVDFNVVSSSSAATSEQDGSASDLASLPSSSALLLDEDSPDTTTCSSTTTTRLFGIRHGISVSNEWMRLEENAWGAATYNDQHNFPDAPLSEAGIRQAVALRQHLERTTSALEEEADAWLSSVELIVVSPLTRCLQTYQHAVEPLLLQGKIAKTATATTPVLALPLMTERVYTVSETGRPVSKLQSEFPTVDWSEFEALEWCNPDCWWYDPSVETPFHRDGDSARSEWRPADRGQRYLAAGEPRAVFERRMAALRQWLLDRPERRILAVAHWGVLRHFADGRDLDNCQVIAVDL